MTTANDRIEAAATPRNEFYEWMLAMRGKYVSYVMLADKADEIYRKTSGEQGRTVHACPICGRQYANHCYHGESEVSCVDMTPEEAAAKLDGMILATEEELQELRTERATLTPTAAPGETSDEQIDAQPIDNVLSDLKAMGVDTDKFRRRVVEILDRHAVRKNDDMKSPADWDRMLDELEKSYKHHQAVQSRGHSTFIKETGRNGGSPWAELMGAVEAMIEAKSQPATPTIAAEQSGVGGTRAVPATELATPREQTSDKLAWYALLAKAGGLGDFAIGFIQGDPLRPLATIGYYGDRPVNCEDLDENMLPKETPERRALIEARIAESIGDMHNGGHGLVAEQGEPPEREAGVELLTSQGWYQCKYNDRGFIVPRVYWFNGVSLFVDGSWRNPASCSFFDYVPLVPATELAALRERGERLEEAFYFQQNEIEQTLGKALGYPWFKDDQKNFPGATDENGVCVGEHIAETLAMEAANKLATLTAERDAARSQLAAEKDTVLELREQLVHLKSQAGPDSCADVFLKYNAAKAEIADCRATIATKVGDNRRWEIRVEKLKTSLASSESQLAEARREVERLKAGPIPVATCAASAPPLAST